MRLDEFVGLVEEVVGEVNGEHGFVVHCLLVALDFVEAGRG